ncbi:MAG: hypothetical protein IIU65_04975 [Clostridia bacterium]|nr:hypothetical protein [Clostridia bacterium]
MKTDISLNPLSDKGLTGFIEDDFRHKCKAKYYPDKDGNLRLASVQEFSLAVFSEGGFEKREILPPGYMHILSQLIDARNNNDEYRANYLIKRLNDIESKYYENIDDIADNEGDFDLPMTKEEYDNIRKQENLQRAIRRAKTAAFDLIECNHDLDCFGTLTFDPKKIDSKSYSEVYEVLKVWLSNRVQRNGLKYILCPEHHKDGEKIHFHCIFNSESLKLRKARSANSNRLLKTRRGGVEKQLYNISDWPYGFTSCELITGESSTDKVAKYIFKYMGKQLNQKIGGRFFLHGGKFTLPTYAYGERASDFFEGREAKSKKACQITSALSFYEWNFI